MESFFSKLSVPMWEMIEQEWYLGLTSFGGPAVHFQIFRKKFVKGHLRWIDDQTVRCLEVLRSHGQGGQSDECLRGLQYQEMFALCQSLPGPGSTKMLFAINVIHGGFVVGLTSFLVWSLPGALAAYSLAVGISHIGETLPNPVYALLSGLNSATVGIIALAAVQLSQKAITDKLTRFLVFFGGAAGMLYNALWYFPVLMVAGCLSTIIYDHEYSHKVYRSIKSRGKQAEPKEEDGIQGSFEMQTVSSRAPTARLDDSSTHLRNLANGQPVGVPDSQTVDNSLSPSPTAGPQTVRLSWTGGILIITAFFATFIAIMVLRGSLRSPPRDFSLFANLYLAGTIIFGGGPVVIPLLREYVVSEGWVSPRDFLLGLAIIQAFPGPNFNFAVYLGSLAVAGSGANPILGALIGYVAIFVPGLALHTGTMGLWKNLRRYRRFVSALRGVNATAVGLTYAAVYRLWTIGFIDKNFKLGASLGTDPWFLVIAATAYTSVMWFRASAPVAILLGGAMGMIWYGVVSA